MRAIFVFALLISFCAPAYSAVYPSTAWAATNLMNKTSAGDVRDALGLSANTNGTLIDATLQGSTRIGDGNILTNPVVSGVVYGDGGGLSNVTATLIVNSPWQSIKYPDGGNGVEYSWRPDSSGLFDLVMHTNGSFSIAGTFSGNGGGLSNALDIIAGTSIVVSTGANMRSFTISLGDVPAEQPIVFNGKVTLISNVFLSSLSFGTNAAAVNVLNLNCTDQAVATNNNILYAGMNIPAEYGVTNSAWAAVLITNNGALPTIMVSFPGCIGDTNFFVTNQSAFLVKKYPNMGTNVVHNALK